MAVLLLREDEIRRLIGVPEAIDAARAAFVKLAHGEVEQPDVLSLDLRAQHGEVHAKGAYLHGAAFYSIKVAAGFYDNPRRGLPVTSGAVWVFDAQTGVLRALLFDNGFLTDLRTGAAGAVAADLLAPATIGTATIVGTGTQARWQLDALLAVRVPSRALVWGRSEHAARSYAAEMSERLELPVIAVSSLREAVAAADLVVTTTPAREPLIDAEWVGPGTHVTAVGADLPGKVELDPRLLARATVVCDRLAQCRTQGEVAFALQAGTISLGDVHAELGDIAAGKAMGRLSADAITVCDLTGVGALDAAVAEHVVTRAIEHGVGEALDG